MNPTGNIPSLLPGITKVATGTTVTEDAFSIVDEEESLVWAPEKAPLRNDEFWGDNSVLSFVPSTAVPDREMVGVKSTRAEALQMILVSMG